MTVKQQFLLVQNDVIRTLDNRFVKYLDATMTIKFSGSYPQEYEDLLLTGTFNSQIKVQNLLYNPYSEEFFELTKEGIDREYIVKCSFVHNYCFELFCVYFEMVSNDIPKATIDTYFKEFKFFLNIQITTTNNEYNESYSRYWKEIILRVTNVLENGGHEFYNRFTGDQRQDLVSKLNPVAEKINNN